LAVEVMLFAFFPTASKSAWFLARRTQGHLTKQHLPSLVLKPEGVCKMVLEGWDLVEFDRAALVQQRNVDLLREGPRLDQRFERDAYAIALV
jgi:hypothetical protein